MSLSLSLQSGCPDRHLRFSGPPSDMYHQSTAVFSQDEASGAFLRPQFVCKLVCCQAGGGDVGGRGGAGRRNK